ncbi:MAG TPA: helix-turn-helix domain-containing protein [Polyangiaceae bacterium]|nr:helix-turn-helix domain-containing protein [Polyangiaceae bacterium]
MLDQVLVVACERPERTELTSMLSEFGVSSVIDAEGPEHALTAIARGVDAAFLFASMPDGVALRVARDALRACPAPPVIVVSQGPHPDLFALARAGAAAHLNWPLNPEEVWQCLEATSLSTDLLEADVRSLVGRVGIKDAQGWVRKTMLEHALDASHGSRRGAARLLGVTRPAIQRMLREKGDSTLQKSSTIPPSLRRSVLRPIPTVVSTVAEVTKRRRRSF